MARRRSTVLTGKAMYLTGDTYEGTFVEGLRAGDTNEVQIAERIYCGTHVHTNVLYQNDISSIRFDKITLSLLIWKWNQVVQTNKTPKRR